MFGFWLQRLALSEEPWPRRVHLEVVGFPADANGRRIHKLAQDDDFELLVHARHDAITSLPTKSNFASPRPTAAAAATR